MRDHFKIWVTKEEKELIEGARVYFYRTMTAEDLNRLVVDATLNSGDPNFYPGPTHCDECGTGIEDL